MTVTGTDFPLDSYKDAAVHMRRPFTTDAVKFKVQSVTKAEQPKALIVAYIDARLVVERLNLIVPHLWHDDYEMAGKGLMCKLTVDGITRRDVGEGVGKALVSDALKRAAVKFGIGVSLYAIPQTWLDVDGRQVKQVRDNTYMQAAGEQICRKRYAEWLDKVGVQKFGEPLDHGDSGETQGDPVDAPHAAPVDCSPTGCDKPLTDSGRAKIAQAVGASGIDPAMVYAAAGFTDVDDVTTVADAIKVRAELDRVTGQVPA